MVKQLFKYSRNIMILACVLFVFTACQKSQDEQTVSKSINEPKTALGEAIQESDNVAKEAEQNAQEFDEEAQELEDDVE